MVRRGKAQRLAAVEEAIVVAFFDIANHLSRRGEALARRASLSTPQWMVLLEIAGDAAFSRSRARGGGAGEGVLPSEIATRRGVSRATVSAVLAQLERQGLIRRADDEEDGRRWRLRLTAAGRRALSIVEPERRRANRRLLSALSDVERVALLGYLRSCLVELLDG
jgi:DNA-binding MarR family transcriptional regulator